MSHTPAEGVTTVETLRWGALRTRKAIANAAHKHSPGRLALPLTFLFLLAGCGRTYPSPFVQGTPQPLSCGIFTDSRLQEFSFGVDSPADVTSAVVNTWGIGQDQFRFTDLYGGVLRLEWRDSRSGRQTDHWAYFGKERRLERVEVSWSPPATLAQVISCLGDPDLYNAHYGPSHHEAHFELVLWYADEGIFVTHDHLTITSSRTPLKPAQQIDGFLLVDPERPEQTLSSLLPSMGYADTDNPGIQAYLLCLLREWPGSIEAAEATGVTSYDDNTRCKSVTYW